jgi:hypothetical protein
VIFAQQSANFRNYNNDGTDAVNGTFINAAEGAVFGSTLNTAYRITYRGGDGNDVAITRVNRANFDFDADGKSDISVFRPTGGFWYELLSRNGNFASQQFGASDDKIVPADYDGDTKTDIAVFRPSNGVWYQLRSSDNTLMPSNSAQTATFQCRMIMTATANPTLPFSDLQTAPGINC